MDESGIDRALLDRSLNDGRAFLRLLQARGIRWVCLTAGSPYYCPHVVRPALFPPADGYEPPEDPLRGVARQIAVTARLKAEFPDIVFVGSAYTYLQEWLPNVGQYTLRHGMTDFVGLGRMMLSYPELAADVLAGDRSRASTCAGPSATARPVRGSASSLAATRSIRSTSRTRTRRSSKKRRRRPGHEPAVPDTNARSRQIVAVLTAFLSLFAVVGFALYGLPRFYPYFVQELGWTPAAGHLGERVQQDLRRAGVRVSRRPARRSLRSAPAAARRDRDGRRRARRPLVCDEPRRVLPLLHVQRARVRVRRTAAEPGAAVALVRQGPRQGDGDRVPRDRRRRRARAAARVRAYPGVWLARRASHPRAADDRDRAADGVLRPRAGARGRRRGVIGCRCRRSRTSCRGRRSTS